MSEGELKKRLNYHADNNDYFMVDIELIEEVLDEAKQELLLEAKRLAYTYGEPKILYLMEKWFGDK